LQSCASAVPEVAANPAIPTIVRTAEDRAAELRVPLTERNNDRFIENI